MLLRGTGAAAAYASSSSAHSATLHSAQCWPAPPQQYRLPRPCSSSSSRKTVRAAVAEYQRSPSVGAIVAQPQLLSPSTPALDRDATATASTSAPGPALQQQQQHTLYPTQQDQHVTPQTTPHSSPTSPVSPDSSPHMSPQPDTLFSGEPMPGSTGNHSTTSTAANGHAHGPSSSTRGSTMQRLSMVATSLESIEDSQSPESSPSPSPSSPSPDFAAGSPPTSSQPPQASQAHGSPAAAAAAAAQGPQSQGASGVQHSAEQQGSSGAAAAAAAAAAAQQRPARSPQEEAAARKLSEQEDLMVEEISSCESWKDLLEILEDEAGPDGTGLTLFVGVKALTRMASLGRGLPASETAALRAERGFQALASTLVRNVHRMKPIQLANSLEAFANLGVLPHTEGMKAYLERCKVCAERMNARDVATLLHAFAVMRVRPGRRTLDALGFRAVQLLRQGAVQQQSLSMLVHACGALEYKNRVLLAAAADAAVRAMPSLTPQAVANLAWAFARLDYYSYSFQRSALRAYASNPSSYRPQEVCNLLWASTRQRFHPEDVLAVMVRSLAENAHQLRGADFASIFLALGTFDVHPGAKMLGQLLGAAERQLTSLQPVELCNLYWGLGLMGEGLHPTAIHIASLLPDHYEANRLNPGLLRQVFTAYLGGKLTLANTNDGADPKLAAAAASISFPTPMMDAMKRAWVANTMAHSMGPAALEEAAAAGSNSSSSSSSGSSRMASRQGSSAGASSSSGVQGPRKPAMAAAASTTTKRALPQIMQALGVRHGVGRPTADGLASIDIALRPGPDRFLALQVVEEHEHTANTGQFLGPQRFQSAVLEASGWEVKHIMAKDLRMLDEAAWPAFIADLLRNMGVRVSAGAVAAAQAQQTKGGKAVPKKSVGAGGRGSGNRGLDMLMEGPRARQQGGKKGGGRR